MFPVAPSERELLSSEADREYLPVGLNQSRSSNSLLANVVLCKELADGDLHFAVIGLPNTTVEQRVAFESAGANCFGARC